MRHIGFLIIVALVCTSLSAGQISPVQKSSTVQNTPTQKSTVTPQGSPVQKTQPMGSPVQKTTPMGSPVQKSTVSVGGEMIQLTADEQCILDRIRANSNRPLVSAVLKRCLARKLRKRMPFSQNVMYAPEYYGEVIYDAPQTIVRAPFTRVEVRRRF